MSTIISRKSFIIFISTIILFVNCINEQQRLRPGLESITTQDLAKNTKILSSDEYEGRAPASNGETKTVSFLEQQFRNIGLQPGNGQSFFQEIPMVVITANQGMQLKIKSAKKSFVFNYNDQFIALTRQMAEMVRLADSEIIFVGYGIVAPEYQWDDYEGLDVRGKTVVVLVNDPGFATQDSTLFTGRAMTYYGRWIYKYEEAARQGAGAVFIIHETAPAAYPWSVVQSTWNCPRFNLIPEEKSPAQCRVEGWLHLDVARKLFEIAGIDYSQAKSAAAKRGFKAMPLGLTASLDLKSTVKKVASKNVVALLPGTRRPNEYVIFMSHWDHFGRNPALKGDQIFNGAYDNATGTAGLIELSKAYKKLDRPPHRSIVFLSTTAEEQLLLGAEYYATHPIFPAAKTAAVINMDGLNIYGPMKDITVIGLGLSELDQYIQTAAKEDGRVVNPDPTPEHGAYFRADHFSFAKQGIPVIYPSLGRDHIIHGKKWTQAMEDKYIAEKYHKPSDEFDPNWDLTGAVDDLRLLFKVGYRLAMESTFPNWKHETEYRAKRDADLQRQDR